MDVNVAERLIESSPAIVLVLLGACVMLWRTLREEIASCRTLHEQSIKSQQQLTAAIERLAEKIEDAR